MFEPVLLIRATALISSLRAGQISVATAESCTGGLIAALLTEIAGASDVFDRGYVTYSNEAKTELLGVAAALITSKGAVSREVALAMAEGAASRVPAKAGGVVAVSVTGVAGPGGGSVEKPVGLVHVAVARTGHPTRHLECRFGEILRCQVRRATVLAALDMLEDAIGV